MHTSNNTIYLALYKGRRDGAWYKPSIAAARLSDWTIRTFTQSIYSHCELAVARENGQYDCYSSSIRDGGVRRKTMKLPTDKWDLIEIRQMNAFEDLRNHFGATRAQAYDWLGALGVVTHWKDSKRKWFCSEWCAAALGLANPERFSPETLARHFKMRLAHKP